jgi:heme o synthase
MQSVSKIESVEAAPSLLRAPSRAYVSDMLSLAKPRLSSLVLLTTAGGLWLSNNVVTLSTWVVTLLATAMTVASANAMNCAIERERDRLMERTARRPLATGRLATADALVFSAVLLLVAIPWLALEVNALTAVLAALAWLSYVTMYTPMKAKSAWAIVVGAVPGALPPLIGWTASTGRIETPGLVLFGILFFWQLPHFVAISLFRKSEYRAAGLTSIPLVLGDNAARWIALVTTVCLTPCAVALSLLQVTGVLYGAVASVLSLVFMAYAAAGVVRSGDSHWARRFFFTSLVYLTVLMVAIGLDRIVST